MQTTLIAALGLVALFIGGIVNLVLPDMRIMGWGWGIIAIGIVLLASAIIIDYRRVRAGLVSKRGRFSVSTGIMVSIFIGIILFVNAISMGASHRFDFTGLAQFTLTSQTKDFLSQMEQPVRALLFTTPNDPYSIGAFADTLLTEYQNHTDELSIEKIDPDEHPEQARQYGVSIYPSVVFASDNRQRLVLPQEISDQAEHAFTSAILEVTGINSLRGETGSP